MASRRGRIGDYTRAKLDSIISSSVVVIESGDITRVSGDVGLTGGGASGAIILEVDYAGTDSVIGAAADGTGITVASDDQILVSDTDDSNNVKYVNVSQLPSGAPTDAQYVTLATDSDLSAERVLTAGDGVTMADGGAGSTITVAVDYAGADSVIMAATDGTSATVATNDKVILKDESDGSDTVKYVNISQLGAGVVAGSDTEIQYNDGGAFGATSSFSFYSSSFGGEATLQLRHDVVSDARKDEHPTMAFTRSGPLLKYDDMNLGKISFRGGNSNNDDHEYAYMIAQASDTSDANEGGYIKFYCAAGGIDPGDSGLYNLLSIGGEDEARMSAVVVNEESKNCDFRVESDSETHKLFVDASANSIGINQSSPDNSVGLDINDDALFTDDKKLYFGTGKDAYIEYETTDSYMAISGSAQGIAMSGTNIVLTGAVKIDGPGGLSALHVEDMDSYADVVVVSAQNTLGAALMLDTALSKTPLKIDSDYSGIGATIIKGIAGDILKTGASTSNNDVYGMYMGVENLTATDGNNQIVGVCGFTNAKHAADAGTMTAIGGQFSASSDSNGTTTTYGLHAVAAGGDTNYGIQLKTGDGANDAHIIMVNQADTGDLCKIHVGTAGATTITTVDDDNAAADIRFNPDGDVLVLDDIRLGFGSGSSGAESYIVYDETTSDKLIMSGAHGGTYFSGSSIHVGPLGAAGTTYGPSTTTPVTAFDTITDLGTTAADGTACDMISDGQMGGQMIRMGVFDASVNVVGELVSCRRAIWISADASAAAGASGALDLLIAIAMAVDGDADEGLVLLRGIARIPSTLFTGTAPSLGVTGKPIYASETAGSITLDIPTTSGAIVRVIGYLLDASSSDGLIYFNPDNTWVTIA